jgi:hypothetical protein
MMRLRWAPFFSISRASVSERRPRESVVARVCGHFRCEASPWWGASIGLRSGAVVSVAAIVEDPAVARHLVAAVLLASLVACAGSGSGSGTTAPSGQDPCADFEVEVEKFWSASVRAEVQNRGGQIDIEKRSGVINKMDRISEDWVMMRTSVCKDHFVRALITKEQYAARVQCFDDRLERQRTLATALTGAGADLATIEGSLDDLIAAPKSCESTDQ